MFSEKRTIICGFWKREKGEGIRMELCRYPKQGNVRVFHIEAIQIPIVYNKYGDHDPDGLLYVLEEDSGSGSCQYR